MKNFFEQHEKISIVIFVLIIFLVIDLIFALIFIPDRHDYSSFRIKNNYFHHGLRANQDTWDKWGNLIHRVYTNSLGFKDKHVREIPTESAHPRILFMGDSFVEGSGMSYEKSFVGLLDERFKKSGVEVLNGGVASYSPKLYYLKIKYLIEKKKLNFNHIIVFIDISDIENEVDYQGYSSEIESNKPYKEDFGKWFQKRYKHYFRNYSFLYSRFRMLRGKLTEANEEIQQDKNIPRWTYDEEVFRKWGEKGLSLAQINMQNLVDLTRAHNKTIDLVIYPWPDQIKNREINSKQVVFWQTFAKLNGIRLINLFPDFINDQSVEDILKAYFIEGDCHWNSNGHNLVADKLWPIIKNFQ